MGTAFANQAAKDTINGFADANTRVTVRCYDGRLALGRFYHLHHCADLWIFVPDDGVGANDGKCFGVVPSDVIFVEFGARMIHVNGGVL